jgi:poly-beta-1,6 N-acetyl-D-glucosamine synthase
LQVLRKSHVHATFFVLGQHIEANAGILMQCWRDGNEVGNHSYSHPSIAAVSPLRAELEVNATQRIIECMTGHSTRLFRPPYGEGADANAAIQADADLMLRMQKLGYITVGMNVDPHDYERSHADEIVQDVIAQIRNNRYRTRNIVLLHDGGGNRDRTVAALPRIIRELRKQGYRFVTVSELLGPNEHRIVFPAVAAGEAPMDDVDRLVFEAGFAFNRALQIVFLAAILLGVSRILAVAPLAIIQSRRSRRQRFESGFAPPVTVIVPSYNEDKVICRTVRAILNSDYADLRVIVVDDGSTDDTARVMQECFGSEPRVTYVHKEKGGKASAINEGISRSDTEIIISIDADTMLARDAISYLVRHFENPKVGAVAGNVKVGNKDNPLTIWQSVEYITSQNFDRRAYAAMEAVPVIPGALGAWRSSAIARAGGYHTDTLAEDTDLTFRVKLLGYRTITENRALAYTEVPDTVRGLAKQRFRWSFGILQSLWKHRDLLLRPKQGAFSMFVMPSMWVYSIGFQAFSPVVDIAVLLSLLRGQFLPVLSYYAAFFVLVLVASFIAFRIDGESPRDLVWLFWQRFFYRQFMYYVIIRSILAALRGGTVGWGKLQRKATANLPGA